MVSERRYRALFDNTSSGTKTFRPRTSSSVRLSPWSDMAPGDSVTNLFLVLLFVTLAGEVLAVGEGKLLPFLISKLTIPLLGEGLALLFGLVAVWCLCTFLAVGCWLPYHSYASHLSELIGILLLSLGPPLVSHYYLSTWPFIQKIALAMQSAVLLLKFYSFTKENRSLESEVRQGGQGEGGLVDLLLKDGLPPGGGGEGLFVGVTESGRPWELTRSPWPRALTVPDALAFLFSPSLSYCPAIPRYKSISPLFLLERAVICAFFFFISVLLHENYLQSLWAASPGIHSLGSFLRLFFAAAAPLTLLSIAIFFITFVAVCPFFSEVTREVDRAFHGAWHESTSFEQFSQAWNAPVGDFLHHYVYTPLLFCGKPCALCATFILSILYHELLIWGAMGSKWRFPYLALFSVTQLPLIPLMKLFPGLKGKRAGNIFFWLGLSTGWYLSLHL